MIKQSWTVKFQIKRADAYILHLHYVACKISAVSQGEIFKK